MPKMLLADTEEAKKYLKTCRLNYTTNKVSDCLAQMVAESPHSLRYAYIN